VKVLSLSLSAIRDKIFSTTLPPHRFSTCCDSAVNGNPGITKSGQYVINVERRDDSVLSQASYLFQSSRVFVTEVQLLRQVIDYCGSLHDHLFSPFTR